MTDKYKPFSERFGHTQPKLPQREDMGTGLRNGLWNAFYACFNDEPHNAKSSHFQKHYALHSIFRVIWHDYFVYPSDQYRNIARTVTGGIARYTDNKEFVKETFISGPWNKVYDLIEFTIRNLSDSNEHSVKDDFICKCNEMLKKEKSAYQITSSGIVVEITSKQDIEAIEAALQIPYKSAKKHIEKALTLFSDRENPDYENSIKESISAVESIAKEVTGNKKATLGQLTQKLNLHPAFEDGLKKLYGFTSGAGIRHGDHSDNPLKVGANTARFMLVTCSAFVNYIITQNPEKQNRQ